MSTADRIAALRAEGEAAVAAATATAELEEVRVRFLGRKAELPNLLRDVGKLPPEERGPVGKGANQARQALQAAVDARAAELEALELEQKLAADVVDVTLPGTPASARRPPAHPHRHPARDRGRVRRARLPRGRRAGDRPRLLQLRRAQPRPAPPGAGGVGHVLRRRRRGPAHADLADAGADDGAPGRRRCTSSSRAASTGPTTTPRTRRSSTRSRAWRSTRA